MLTVKNEIVEAANVEIPHAISRLLGEANLIGELEKAKLGRRNVDDETFFLAAKRHTGDDGDNLKLSKLTSGTVPCELSTAHHHRPSSCESCR
jgi:hypothetical protein